MTPSELDKELTMLLHNILVDTGFAKKRICTLRRRTDECEQYFTFSFTRDRGLPGNMYTLLPKMSFTFTQVDKLTSAFLGEKYSGVWGTGARPFYTVVPESPVHKYKYCSDESLEEFAEMLANDFRLYALSFYDKYDTLDKLENYFENHTEVKSYSDTEDWFDVIRANGHWCCKAAVLYALGKKDKLQDFLDETDLLNTEEKERIREMM